MKENKGECNPVLDRILKTLRIRCLKQIEPARCLGINEGTFTKWKNGENTSFMRHIGAIAGFLHVDKDCLLYGTNAEESLLDLHPDEIWIYQKHHLDRQEEHSQQSSSSYQSICD